MTIAADFTITDPGPTKGISRLFAVLNECVITSQGLPTRVSKISIILDAPAPNLDILGEARYRRAAASLFTSGEVVVLTHPIPTVFQVATFKDIDTAGEGIPLIATRLELPISLIIPPQQNIEVILNVCADSVGGPLAFWTGSLEIETSEPQERLNPEKETCQSVFPCETSEQRVLIPSQ